MALEQDMIKPFEERQVRTLAHRRHAPADWIAPATMVARSWDGQRTRQIAQEVGCHPPTVRDRLHAFNERGLAGLGMKPGSGRKPRLSAGERSTILALVKRPPPGKATYELTVCADYALTVCADRMR